MASIVSSVLDVDSVAQKDGRFYVRELHTDSVGFVYRFEYLADVTVDRNAVMTARAGTLIPNMQTREMIDAIVNDASLSSLVYNTPAQAAAFVRDHYRDATRGELALTARWILDRIAAGEVTDTQVRNAFNLTAAQWTTLKTKMQNLVASYTTVDTAVGE